MVDAGFGARASFWQFSILTLAKESFAYSETARLRDLLDEASRCSGVSRGQAFEDFLHLSLCALSGGQMEEQYLTVVQKYTAGRPGERGCDRLATAFGELVAILDRTRVDILGDLFQGAITHGEAGQFLTPELVCESMARMLIDQADIPDARRKTVADPCCGSGRMLLAAAKFQPHWEFVGQDIDLRCVRMTAINLALRNLYGYVIWGNGLTAERRLVYRTGFRFLGFIREVPVEACPRPPLRSANVAATASSVSGSAVGDDREPPRHSQLHLF